MESPAQIKRAGGFSGYRLYKKKQKICKKIKKIKNSVDIYGTNMV